jgi:arabinofuranosyltransferase
MDTRTLPKDQTKLDRRWTVPAWSARPPALPLLVPIGILCCVVLIRTAWLCDDAYLTFRTIDNFVHGYGLRWNVAERVQAFTHPLWLFLLTPAYALTREIFLTSLIVSIALSLAAIAVLAARVARTNLTALLGVAVLFLSRAFVDYSTSGLENPLSHLLLALFAAVYLSEGESAGDQTEAGFGGGSGRDRLLDLTLIASLCAVNRMDTVLLLGPAVAAAWLSRRGRRGARVALLGMVPFLAWEIFSLIYYGSPFPNPAYAKLGSGLGPGTLIVQGFHYLEHTIRRDPLTLMVIAAGLASPVLFRRECPSLALPAGILLYLAYVVRIGGDFMGGRFLAAPLLLSVLLLSRIRLEKRPLVAIASSAAVVLLGLAWPNAPILTGPGFGRDVTGFQDAHGVADERRVYFQRCGLLQWRPGKAMPVWPTGKTGRGFRKAEEPAVEAHLSVGLRGFVAGPRLHIVDLYGLGDPLLARLPAMRDPRWRIGHFRRHVPPGYLSTLQTGVNAFEDEELGRFYEELALITRGPIWSGERWRAIVRMNLGRSDSLIDRDRYRDPKSGETEASGST